MRRDIDSDLLALFGMTILGFLLGVIVGITIVVHNLSINIEEAVKNGNTLKTEFYKESEGSTSYEKYSEWLEMKLKDKDLKCGH